MMQFSGHKPAAPVGVGVAGVSGTVFEDDNGDGNQENGEIGLAGVQVYADLGNVGYFVAGDPTATTNASGVYTLEGLTAGNYIIRQVVPSGFAQTYPVLGRGFHETLAVGPYLPPQSFGDRYTGAPSSEITGTVFGDTNGDGVQDNGESGLGGVQVYLDLGNVGYFVEDDPTTFTNDQGGYTLSGLAVGSYIVRQIPPDDTAQTAPSGGLGRHVTIAAGQTVSAQNFGDKTAPPPGTAVTGSVFDDANGDGIQDNGELGIPDIQVYLDLGNLGYFVNGDPTTSTDSSGNYFLQGLAAGNYIVRQVLPPGYLQTTPGNGYGRHVTLAAGQTVIGQVFGDKV
jgi:serine-aspartate repeat-containing protein C/D/E